MFAISEDRAAGLSPSPLRMVQRARSSQVSGLGSHFPSIPGEKKTGSTWAVGGHPGERIRGFMGEKENEGEARRPPAPHH